MTEFTPTAAAIGGALIGLSSVLLMVLLGRIAGVSGIFGGLLMLGVSDRGWRLAFVLGLVVAPVIGSLIGLTLQAPEMPAWPVIVAAGLLTGFGTRLGGGCTSGHGICGNARLSRRSIVATLTFMLTAIAVVFAVRHGLGG